ncbi:MAG: hypothetical protein ACI8XB_001382 [Patiriisocius sp.]
MLAQLKSIKLENTLNQYDAVVNKCRDIFAKKTHDYGTAWRILRTSSLTDQIFIKANRIRTIQMTGVNRVEESTEDAFIAIVNYAAMALIQMSIDNYDDLDIPSEEAISLYREKIQVARDLMEKKNHDYGEAWRDMRVSSLTDLILMKILRIKQIEDNEGVTKISEGVEGSYLDMLNYSVFALIQLGE